MGVAEILVPPSRAEDRQMVRDVCYPTGYVGDSPKLVLA